MRIIFASDHAGFALKNALSAFVRDELGYKVEDVGAFTLDPNDDYTSFIGLAAQKVAEDPENVRAIILGGSRQGEAMEANRFKGVRAAVFYSLVKHLYENNKLLFVLSPYVQTCPKLLKKEAKEKIYSMDNLQKKIGRQTK